MTATDRALEAAEAGDLEGLRAALRDREREIAALARVEVSEEAAALLRGEIRKGDAALRAIGRLRRQMVRGEHRVDLIG